MSARTRATLFGRQALAARQLASGGWSSAKSSRQSALETTCLALLALRSGPSLIRDRGLQFLLGTQNPNGSWPAFDGDGHDGCWTTSLAVISLIHCGPVIPALERGLKWLLNSKGRESHWLWKWKFRTTDTHVRFDPDKFGWPWMPDTCSWVVPTSFSLLALKQSFVGCPSRDVSFRIARGVQMLLDRVCPQGGWNAGNGVVYGVPLAAHIDATAIALLALRDEPRNAAILASLDWLEQQAQTCAAPWSLAWTILALDAHGGSTEELLVKLAALSEPGQIEDCATVAAAVLALDCPVQGNVFRVLS